MDDPAKLATDLFHFVRAEMPHGEVARVVVRDDEVIEIHSGRPGILIGKQGATIVALKAKIEERIGAPVKVEIREIRRMEVEPILVADQAVRSLERGIAIERVLATPLKSAEKFGAKGFRIRLSGACGDHECESTAPPLDEGSAQYASSEGRTDQGRVIAEVWIVAP